MREYNRQPANTRINKEHRTELKYTGGAPFKNVARVVQHSAIKENENRIIEKKTENCTKPTPLPARARDGGLLLEAP